MPVFPRSERDSIASGAVSQMTVRIVRAPTAVGLAREHVRRATAAHMSAGRGSDLVLLTSELVTNAVEHLHAGPIELAVLRGAASTRIEVRNPSENWVSAPEARKADPDAVDGRGLFLVEQLSDRWGTTDAGCMVWFELDDRSTAEHSPGDDIRRAGDRRKVSMDVAKTDERRRPAQRRGRRDDAR